MSQPKITSSKLDWTLYEKLMAMKDMKTVSERIVFLLNELDLQQTELAEACGVSKQAVQKWIKNNSTPSAEAAIKLRENKSVNDRWLILGQGEPFIRTVHDQFTIEMSKVSAELSPSFKEHLLALAQSFAAHNLTKHVFGDSVSDIRYVPPKSDKKPDE